MKYRAEIDGLRALAVVPVVFFHADFKLFAGGYIGVDIFFVISGYLITSILISDIANNKLSIAHFYERRARRILPALLFVMAVCTPFAWLWMLPDPLENFGQSVFATILFGNNILLYTSSDYWALASEFKPLLHTWSLGVEEQYYVIFPVLLLFGHRLFQSRVFWLILTLAILSLLLSEWAWRNAATDNKLSEANFYLLPTRAWELLAGSISAFIVQRRGVKTSNALSFIGLFAIVFSIFAYDEGTPFPSIFSAVPVFGVVLLVLFADEKTFVARILSAKLATGLGLISYSAYLWHQPLFAFARIYLKAEPSLIVYVLLTILNFILAYLTWRFIEKPFRNRNVIKIRPFVLVIFLFSLLLSAFGLSAHLTNGFPTRVFDSEADFERSSHEFKTASLDEFNLDEFSFESKVKILISGDSYAGDVLYLVNNAYSDLDVEIVFTNTTSCDLMDYGLGHSFWKADIFIFAYDEGHEYACNLELISTVKNNEKEIFLFGTKHFGDNLNWLARIPSYTRASLCQEPNAEFLKIDQRDKLVYSRENYVSIFDAIMRDGCVLVTTPTGELISSDRKHLTVAGVEFLSETVLLNSAFDEVVTELLSK